MRVHVIVICRGGERPGDEFVLCCYMPRSPHWTPPRNPFFLRRRYRLIAVGRHEDLLVGGHEVPELVHITHDPRLMDISHAIRQAPETGPGKASIIDWWTIPARRFP